jgi:hypothetical protein
MAQLVLRPDLASAVEKLASEQGKNAEALLNEWIERDLFLARERRIFEESERFQAQHSALLPLYAGQYIAMRNGEVVDHDQTLAPLLQRVREKYGDEPILITPVTAEPIRTFTIRSPRLSKTGE